MTGVQDNMYNVLYIDFGNEATLSVDSLRVPTPEFFSLPVMAFKCTLTGMK